MERKPKQILKGILLSAIASMFGTNAHAEDGMMPAIGSSDDNSIKELENSSSRVYKNVLKMSPSGNVVAVDSHRSHSSHSSHRSGSYVRSHSSHTSHTSHSSSSSGYGAYSPRRNTNARTTTSGTTSSYNQSTGNSTGKSTSTSHNTGTISGLYNKPTPITMDPKTVEMGDRTMSLNLFGNDINELVKLLVEKLYIRESWVSKKDGFMIYDSKVEKAVKHFQKDADITQSGELDCSTLQILRDWDKEKTTAILGVRDLYFDEELPIAGHDVDELVILLWAKGLTPEPSKVEKRNGHAVYTQDIEMAVKLYQTYNNIADSGRVDETFVKSIKGQAE